MACYCCTKSLNLWPIVSQARAYPFRLKTTQNNFNTLLPAQQVSLYQPHSLSIQGAYDTTSPLLYTSQLQELYTCKNIDSLRQNKKKQDQHMPRLESGRSSLSLTETCLLLCLVPSSMSRRLKSRENYSYMRTTLKR
jgi:hypothetical protein